MNIHVIAAFSDELEKIGAPASVIGRLGRSVWGSGMGRAAVGAVPGAALGYATADEGQGRHGALMGGLTGAVGGLAAPLATRAGRQRAANYVKRRYQANVHQLTGRGSMPIEPGMAPAEVFKQQAAERAGMTSVPGIAKNLVTRPGQALKSAWKGSDRLGKVMVAGDVVMGANELRDKDSVKGTGEKVLGTAGTAGGYLLASRLGMLPAMLVGGGIGTATGLVGRGVDRLTGERKKRLRKKSERMTASASELAQRPSTQYLREQALTAL